MRTAKIPGWQCMVYYRNLWNSSNGNTWPLYVHTTAVIMLGRPDVNVSNTLCVPLSSSYTHDKRLWNWYRCNNSIGFDNPRCMWKLVVYRGAILYPLWHRANLWAKVWVLYRTEFQRPLPGSIHTTNSNPLKLFVTVEVWDRLLSYTLDTAWVIITLWQIFHPEAVHATSFSHNVYQMLIIESDMTFERVNT